MRRSMRGNIGERQMRGGGENRWGRGEDIRSCQKSGYMHGDSSGKHIQIRQRTQGRVGGSATRV